MLKKFMLKPEIEEVLKNKGDFVKIDYLNRYLKEMPPIEMKKFAYAKLAEIYDVKKMFNDSAVCYRNIAINSVMTSEKIKYLMEEAKAFVKALSFDESDRALKRAVTEAPLTKQKDALYEEIIAFYKKYGEELEKDSKKNNAMKLYEKLHRMRLNADEKEMVKQKLIKLYEFLGKRNEIRFLEGMGN